MAAWSGSIESGQRVRFRMNLTLPSLPENPILWSPMRVPVAEMDTGTEGTPTANATRVQSGCIARTALPSVPRTAQEASVGSSKRL